MGRGGATTDGSLRRLRRLPSFSCTDAVEGHRLLPDASWRRSGRTRDRCDPVFRYPPWESELQRRLFSRPRAPRPPAVSVTVETGADSAAARPPFALVEEPVAIGLV